VASSGCGSGVDKSSYVRHNEGVFSTVPLYPGARLVNSYSIGIAKGGPLAENGPPYRGYETWRDYRLRSAVSSAKILSFYERRLDAWRITQRTACEASFHHGAARLYVQACLKQGQVSSVLLAVDYGG
jgi:hypothetical protein